MPDGLSGQEVANAPGMSLTPTPDGEHVLKDSRCDVDQNGDDKLNVADVLKVLDVSENCQTCLLQIAGELNKLRCKL